MSFVLFYFAFCGLAAMIASSKGLSGPRYFFISAGLSPLFGIVAALVAQPDRAAVEQIAVASGDSKKFPFCAELIKWEAVKCRFCGSELPSLPPPRPPAELGKLRCKICGARSLNYPSAHSHATAVHGLAGRADDESIEEA